MTLKEIDKIIKENKNKRFNTLAYETKVILIRMKKVFSLAFNIPENEIYNIQTYIVFFTRYLKKEKPMFDLNKIKLELINSKYHNEDLFLKIALKYLEPLEVIKEIYQDIKDVNDKKFFINSKLYCSSELGYMFNCFNHSVVSLPNFNTLTYLPYNTGKNYWLGKDINNNLNWLVGFKYFKDLFKKDVEFYSFSDTCKILDIDKNSLWERIKRNKKTFGVKITTEEKIKEVRHVLIKKSDVDKAKANKKLYIETSVIFNKFPEYNTNYKNYKFIISSFNILYNKNFSFKEKYIKKETFIMLSKFFNNFLHNFDTYIENICTILNNNGIDSYSKKEAMILTKFNSNPLSKIELELFNKDVISKEEIIHLLKIKLERSFKNKNQQGEKNG